MSLKYDPEILNIFSSSIPPTVNPKIEIKDLLSGSTEALTVLGCLIGDLLPSSEDDIEKSVHQATASDGHGIKIYGFTKKDPIKASDTVRKPGPAVLHFHGGGMVSGSVAEFSASIAAKAAASSVPVYSVEYRLAPKYPDPIPVEDCYTGLLWLHENAEELNIDPMRIAVMGESAGGGLAAGVALMARDRKLSPPLAKQILVYPMIDDRNVLPIPSLEPFATWTADNNTYGWKSLLGTNFGTDLVSPYAAPARVGSVEGLPATYIDVGGLDLFRDENITYATRLIAANVETELHLYPGAPHGFELFGPKAAIVTRAGLNRLNAMKSF